MTREFLAVLMSQERPIEEVADLTLAELIETEPGADDLLRRIREEIGQKIKAERVALDISLEQVRDLSNREIDSAGLSRLERGQAWSADLATRAIAFLAKRRKAADRKAERVKAKA